MAGSAYVLILAHFLIFHSPEMIYEGMHLMRALYRTAAAIAVSLPLVVAGSAIANASTNGSDSDSSMSTGHHHKKHHKAKFDVDQDILQAAKQKNSSGLTNVSGDENKVTNSQENESMQSGTANAFTE